MDLYPLSEKHSEILRSHSGKKLSEINMEQVIVGSVTAEDIRISRESLILQAEVARQAGKSQLAMNFIRSAELIEVPDDEILKMYNMLRPFRSTEKELSDLITELETKYQTAEKELNIRQLEHENQIKNSRLHKTRQLVLGLLIIFLLSGLVIVLLNRRKRLKHEKLQVELKQKLLRSQMNPHFLFNTLNAINHYIQTNQGIIASDYLARYSKLMRQILENSSVEYVTLDNEVSFLKNYLSLQQLRFNQSFDFTITVDKTLNPEMVEIPPMIAQPFVENAIEHGLREKTTDGFLNIDFRLDLNRLLLTITDNGKGYYTTHDKSNEHRSFAINITSERLGKKNAIHIESPILEQSDGTKISIIVPFKRLDE